MQVLKTRVGNSERIKLAFVIFIFPEQVWYNSNSVHQQKNILTTVRYGCGSIMLRDAFSSEVIRLFVNEEQTFCLKNIEPVWTRWVHHTEKAYENLHQSYICLFLLQQDSQSDLDLDISFSDSKLTFQFHKVKQWSNVNKNKNILKE